MAARYRDVGCTGFIDLDQTMIESVCRNLENEELNIHFMRKHMWVNAFKLSCGKCRVKKYG